MQKASNIVWHATQVSPEQRQTISRVKPAVLWLTGLSGCGKSTLAMALEAALITRGHLAFTLDGDNVRHGLNKNLGFSAEDRTENIRRVGEVAKLFMDAGLVVLASFISPFRAERRMVRELLAEGEFVEIFVDTPIEDCMKRDPKGLYAKALKGEIANFTGISSPYERPDDAEITLKTADASAEDLARRVVDELSNRAIV